MADTGGVENRSGKRVSHTGFRGEHPLFRLYLMIQRAGDCGALDSLTVD